MVILAGDHIYKMDYELMLQPARRLRRRRHRRLPRGAAHGGDRLRRDARRRARTPSPPSSRSPPTRPASPASPTWRWPRWASTSSAPSSSMDLLRRDAETPGSSRDFGKDLIPYIVKHGKAVAHRFGASCVRSTTEAVAYWRDVGTVDAYWEANIDLTDIIPELDLYDTGLADLDLRRDHAAGEVRARRGRPARQRRSRASSPATASSPAPASAARCSSPACGCTPTRRSTRR